MLDVADISVNYGQTPCLRRISLNVARGEAVALIGSNGAGKTTLLKTISGLLRPSGGEIRFEGQPIHGLPPQAIVARGIVHVPEGRRIFPDLSVEHNLRIGAHLIRDRAIMTQGLDEVFQRFPRLAERRRQPGGTLSGGEQQMLAIGRALMARPRLLLLDEPSLGLAPIAVMEVMRAIAALKDAGVTVLLVEQNAMLALGLVDRGYVIETGEIVMSGESAVLREHPKVLASYLGFTAS